MTSLATTIKPCILIPTYDNPDTIEDVTRAVRRFGLDVIVVDDGSGPRAKEALKRLRLSDDRVIVVTRPKNGGKGAAVKDGLRCADGLGFTHALQVDADGQHTLDDIPAMLEAARANPTALILGEPQFDETAPKGRLYGRRVSIFWVRFETFGLGANIADPLCGFRVYPVASAVKAKVSSDRMDFDPEIAVRLVWMGLPVINVPTKVRYVSAEEGGVSHFNVFWDNVLISVMHTRLAMMRVFGLYRLSRDR